MSNGIRRCSGGDWSVNGKTDGPLVSSSHGREIDEEGESNIVVEAPLEGVVNGDPAAAAPIAPPG